MKNKGVTLISLVVTIVVLLILAGITIGTIFNDNGIIKKAQEAANATEEAARNDQAAINGLLNEMDSIINGTGGGPIPIIGNIKGKITWSTGSATLTLTTDVEGVTIQYRKNSESNWTNYTSAVPSLLHGDKVYARGIKGGETVINEKEFKIQDTIAPTVTIANASSTTNSISATATATDNEAGMGSSPQYTFYIKKTAEADSAYTQIGSSANTSVTKGGLEQNISYTIKVEVADVAGNKGQATKEITTGKIADAGEGLTNGAIIASSPVWSGGRASITLSTSSGLTIQYQKGGISGSWTTGTSVTGLHHRDTVFARLTDGNNYGGEASITILDTENPMDARINLSGTNTNTEGSITATITLMDNESGVNTTASKWIYNTNSGNIGTNESSYNNTFSSNGQTITLKATTAGTYYLHVLTVDNAGNKKETISNAVTTNQLATGVSVSPTSATLDIGKTQQLTVTVTPTIANNKNVTWSSNNTNVAIVSSSGLVTAKSEGMATITVKTADGSNKTATCSVTVKMKPTPIEDKVKAGDYVYYIDGTGATRKCAVLYDSSSSYGVEIITMESVENITIGNNSNISSAVADFNNAIEKLNSATNKYINSTYVDKSRCVGSLPNSPSSQGGYVYHDGYSFRTFDNNYVEDTDQMANLGLGRIGVTYWLASRATLAIAGNSYPKVLGLRYTYSGDGGGNHEAIVNIWPASDPYNPTKPHSITYGLRPVFHLKSNVKITGGNGTSDSPYTLGT